MSLPVRFDDALEHAISFAREHLVQFGGEVVIVRDLMGRIRFALEHDVAAPDRLALELHGLLGAFSAGPEQIFLHRSTMIAPDAIFGAAELREIAPRVHLLERWVTGADWLRAPLARVSTKARRLTFFGSSGFRVGSYTGG